MAVIPLYRQDSRHPQARACAACEVRSQALFGALDAAGLDRIHTHIASLDVAPDQPVYTRGQAGAAAYTVRAGIVRLERIGRQGERRVVRLAGRGDLIGQESLLMHPYADDAVACTPVQLCRIPGHLIDQLASSSGSLPRELMQRWQTALDAAEAWVAELSSGPAHRRLLHLLQRLQQLGEPEAPVWLPRREEIGAMLDLTVETASRQISRLRREGVIELLPPRGVRIDSAALDRALAADGAG